MAGRDVVVVGASAGGVEALRALVAGLPADFSASLLVVLHMPPRGGSVLPKILARSGPLPAMAVTAPVLLEQGHIYVAAPDRHLVVSDRHATAFRGPRENGHRPAVDVLFRTAARACGARVIGVVLSGALDDGTAGLAAVTSRGGVSVVQDPQDALYPGMPSSALEHVAVDHVLTALEIGRLLDKTCRDQVASVTAPTSPDELDAEADMVTLEIDAMNQPRRPGTPAGLSCPDCAGALFELRDRDYLRYRCRVGHAWSPDSLLTEQSNGLESALWMALRSLEEKAALSRRLAGNARERDRVITAGRYEEAAEEASTAALSIRQLLTSHFGSAESTPEAVHD